MKRENLKKRLYYVKNSIFDGRKEFNMKDIKKYVGMMMALITVITFSTPNANAFAAEWILHTATKLEEAGEYFDFCLGDYNGDGILDLYAIKKSATGSKSTELHVLDGKSNFQEFLLHAGTKLEEAEERFDFCLGDYNGDGTLDLYAIKKSATGSKSTELHVLDGKSNFQEFLLHAGTKLEEAGECFDFCLGDYNGDGTLDLYGIKKKSTGSNSTEVHVLDGKSNFQEFLLHAGTKLEEAGECFDFCLGDYNGDGTLDLYGIKKKSTGSNSTEVHVLDGKSNFQQFLLHTATELEEAGERFDFCLGDYNGDRTLDLYAIKKSSTGSRTTEVHTLTIDGSQVQQKYEVSANQSSMINLNVPNYKQYDSRWAGNYIGTRTIKQRGCLIVSLAMKASYQTGIIYPDAMKGKLSFSNNDIYWSSVSNLGYSYTNVYGCKITQSTMQTIYQKLSEGKPVIIGGTNSSNGMHWIIIKGYEGNSTSSFSTADFKINDPNSTKTTLQQFLNSYPYVERLIY